MARAFVRLTIELARVFQLRLKQLGDGVGAHLVAALFERCGELGRALRHPFEGAHRIAHRRRLRKALQIQHQGRVAFAERLRAPALAAHTALGQRPFLQIVLAAVDGGAGEPRDLAHNDQRPVSGRPDLVSGEQALTPLVELAAQRFPAHSYAVPVDHADSNYTRSRRPGICPSRFAAPHTMAIHLSSQVS